jgi:pimeloyl-ACP methyl ester carboxylesterase
MRRSGAETTVRRIAVWLTGAVVAGLGAWLLVSYRGAIEIARARIAAGSEVAETACGPIEYAVAGSGPPILFVHGAGGGYDQGLEFGADLASRGFSVIAMSRFGYLRTPLPEDGSAAAQADAHACLLDALGIERVAAIVGGSAGAPSSVQFALRHGERAGALVLLVPAIYAPRPGDAPSVKTPPGTAFLFDTALRSDFLFWAATRLAPRTMTRAILATPPEIVAAANAEERVRVAEVLEHILPVSPRRLGLLNDGAVTSTLERYALEAVATPTLVIGVADDLFGTFDGARYTAEQIRGARFVGYERGGHLWVGHRQDVAAEIEGFIR